MDRDDLFEQRKRDHIRLALNSETQTSSLSDFDKIRLIHDALPEMNLDEVDLRPPLFQENKLFNEVKCPTFISSMTAGHGDSFKINSDLVECCNHRGWIMGVGSQRRELTDESARREWVELRKKFPKVFLMSNIGLSQVIESGMDPIKKIVDSLESQALIVHLNPLQEALQPEGTPRFKNGLKTISEIVRHSPVPVIIKEVGCGISATTAKKLFETGVFAIDVSGLGGTHWGRIETFRSNPDSLLAKVGKEFQNWGISTTAALMEVLELQKTLSGNDSENHKKVSNCTSIWASGGIRNGIDACKMLAMGADMIGVAQPFIKAAIQGPEAIDELMQKFEQELRISMFCSGIRTVSEFKQRKVWQCQIN